MIDYFKIVYKCDKYICERNWCTGLKKIFDTLNINNYFIYDIDVHIDKCLQELHIQHCERRQRDV